VVATSTCSSNITWSSSAGTVATVTSSGVVTAVAVGTANITATDSNGKTAIVVVTVTATGSAQVSFKFAFDGIYPNAACISSLGDLNIEVGNVPTNIYQSLTTGFAKLDDGKIDSKGNQIFQVTALSLDSTKFGGVNAFNYIKIKGPLHLKRRMCQDGQSSKLAENTVCSIDLTSSTIYDFSEYTLLAGDVDQNGVINTIDLSYIKTRFNAAAEVTCGREGDLNMDGVVNSLDLRLVKEALTMRDDE
jgi:hypothetical protein